MTEASENDCLVRVRAQVMCRDEGTGGWLALGGGGLADVCVGRTPRHAPGETPSDTSAPPAPVAQPSPPSSTGPPQALSESPHVPLWDYYIIGRRISDNTTVLECKIAKDFKYFKVMPTFHHWVTEQKRFGLTFHTAADARAFDKGVIIAWDDLRQGFNKPMMTKDDINDGNLSLMLDGLGGAWPSLHPYKKLYPGPREDDEEQPIFECLNLPSESRSSSENSTASRAKRHPPETPILSAITLPHSHGDGYDDKLDDSDSPYVHLSAVHDYSYAAVGSDTGSPNTKPPLMKQDSGSIKKQYSGPPPLPNKRPQDTFQARLKCRHCHEWYIESANRRGACEFAPDCFKSCIDCVSCIKCAQCMIYHCMSDSEGDFAMHPCACGPPESACIKRWLGITLLSILVPCLCCYPPLRAAHRAARAARRAGGKHAPHPHPHHTQPPPAGK